MLRPPPLSASGHAARVLFDRRRFILAACFALWIGIVLARLWYLQIIRYSYWLNRADGQQERTIVLSPQRGTIYDVHGHPLAMSLPVDSVYAIPSHLAHPHRVALLMGSILGLDPRDLEGRFRAFRTFCWVKRKVSREEAAKVKALNLKGIYFQKEIKRFDPMGNLAASVLGYVGMDDRGLAGVEYSLNDLIAGKPGRAVVMEDARRRTFESKENVGAAGMNVQLTLDDSIQYIAQRALDAAVTHWRAKGGVAIVQDPNTGKILALASDPTFDPNDYQATPRPDRLDRAVQWIYEPGSAFKTITFSSAIDAGLAKPGDLINCQMGEIQLGGRIIHDDPGAIVHEHSGPLTVRQVLAYSSDVGSVKLALRLGEDRFYNDIQKFGFGSKTGILLPGEEAGLLRPLDTWYGVTIGELAIGQGIDVTALQLIGAYSAIANGGTLIQPRIVQSVLDKQTQDPLPPPVRRRVVSAQTAATMRRLLQGVVEYGTGRAAQLDGYTSAGKTGTAEKVAPNGRYSHTDYVASFVGFAPVTRPAITVLVSVDTPRGSIYGADVAAPAWNQIAQQTLGYLGVPHDAPVSAPHNSLQDLAVNRPPLPEADPPIVAFSDPPTPASIAGTPPGAQTDSGGSLVMVNDGPTVTIPNFTGLDQRRVADECQKLGLGLTVTGSGLAVAQAPAAGAQAPGGSQVEVYFTR